MLRLASWRAHALAAVVAVLACACGGGGGGGSGDPPPTPQPPPSPPPPSPPPPSPPPPPPPPPVPGDAATLGGMVFAAATGGATVTAYAVGDSGQPGTALATARADAGGNYTLHLATLPPGPVLLLSAGGNYVSEADGTAEAGAQFASLLAAVPAGSSTVQLNPLTSAIAARASALFAVSASPAAALSAATASVKKLLGVSAIAADPQSLAPAPTATSGDAWWLSALAGSIEQLRAATGIAPADLYGALDDDLSDGKLDGMKGGRTIAVGGRALQPSLFTTELSGAANAYGAAHGAWRGATAVISAALQASAQAAGLVAGNSGSIAPLVTQAHGPQVFFAARSDGLVRVDMADPANPTATRMAAVNQAVASAVGQYATIDGIVIDPTPITVNGQARAYGIIYSYDSPTIFAVNLTDGVVAGSTTLPLSKPAEFSSATAWVAGGVADGQRNLVWLATADGLVGVDPSNLAKAPVRIAQPSGTTINENVGGDPAANIVFSPDYDANGLVVFNLAEARAYVMGAAAWQSLSAGAGMAGSGELDSAALDSQYRLALVLTEAGTVAGLAGYATPSGAAGATGVFAPTRFRGFDTGGYFGGAAIDPVSHTVLLVGEGSGLGVGMLDDPANPNWAGFSAFAAADGSYEFEPHDPHTLGVLNIGGNPYGFLLLGHGGYQAVVLDLKAMLAAPSSGGVLLGDPLADPSIARVLTY